jgi:hypothetical protein
VFSNAYTDPADVNYNPGWGQATVATIESIAGNDVWKLAGLNYQGIDFVEFGGPALDVSGYDTLHLDYWSADATTLNVFLISPGAETPYNVPITTGSWQSVDIPLSAFSGVVDLTNVVQMKFDDNGTGEAATFFIDNIYFYTAGGGGTGGTALVDFETAGTGAGFTWTVFENDDVTAIEIVANPDPSGVNNSATVGKITARVTGNPWAGTESAHGDVGPITLDASNSIIKVMVYKTVISDVGIKFAIASGGAQPEIKVPNTLVNQWEELTFDLSGYIGLPESIDIDQVIFFPDFDLAGRTQDNVVYFDNIRLTDGKVCSILAVMLVFCAPLASHAQVDKVTTYKDANGWKLQVNGEDYFIKGVVWGYTPRGQNYTYNLFGQSDDQIRKILDYDFGLMAKMGVNTIRSFTMIPPEWVTYIYREHGIMSVINPLMGRYGYDVGGKWIPFTDYSDPLTRETLKRDMQEFVVRYKDTPGVLMFAFGNESNYGLSWSSFEIENLPEGEQNTAKARYLYSLWNEVTEAGKAIDPNHPFTIVNGDIQYIDLIAELIPNLDLLGTNAYRGKSFTGLWRDVEEKLDLPVVFFEFGSDAFNARDFAEDQLSQALVLKDQWQEMYNKAATNGEEGNSIGAFIFEWRDEWWKYLQIENLDIQDNNASWSNQAYLFDWAEGKNNMNEEWLEWRMTS